MTAHPDTTSAHAHRAGAKDSAAGDQAFDDDVWRPSSWDIREVRAFALAVSADLGITVNRLTLNPGAWTQHPRLLQLPGRMLRIDWLDAAAADEVSVRRGYQPRLTMRLLPPLGGPTHEKSFGVASS